MTDRPAKEKARKRNALVHGLYARDIVLPWDCEEDFERLHRDLKMEFNPSGRAEEEAVLDLAVAHWNKQTLWRMRQSAVLKDPFASDIVETGRKSWRGVRKHLRTNSRGPVDIAESIFAGLRAEAQRVQREVEQTSDREKIKILEDKMGTCVRLLADHAAPFLELMTHMPNAEKSFENAYAPESLEKLFRLEAALDARIAKILARLVGLKEFKRTPAGAGAPRLEVRSSS